MSSAQSVESLFARYGSRYRWFATVTAMMGTIATVLSATIVNVALPDIMGTFGMSQNMAQLLSTGFLAAMTGTMLLNAWMVDSFGQRATFISAMSLFIVASTAGGLAPNSGVLILSRILQGGAAGILQPLAMQVIFQVFPHDKRGSAMGVYGIGVVLAPALGPTLGGIMVDTLSWRYVFFLALPFCAMGVLLASVFMPGRTHTRARQSFDWLGFGLMSAFLVSILSGLSHGQRDGWLSDSILIDFIVAAVSLYAFIGWESLTRAPLLNLRLFENRVFSGASVVAFIFGAGIYGSTYLIPLFVQTIQGYTPTRSGLLLMPAGFILAFIFPLAGRLTDKAPAYLTIVFGLAVFALSSYLLVGVGTDTAFWQMAGWIVLGRVGLGFIMPGLNAGALKALTPAQLNQGSGAINFVRQLGGAFGVNLLSVCLQSRTQVYSHAFASAQTSANGATAHTLQLVSEQLAHAGLAANVQHASAMYYLGKIVYLQSNILGYRDSFLVVAIVFALGILPALMMRIKPAASAGAKDALA